MTCRLHAVACLALVAHLLLALDASSIEQDQLPTVDQIDNQSLDPQIDGWTSEAFSELASEQLVLLARGLTSPHDPDTKLAPFAAARFHLPQQTDWTSEFKDRQFQVSRFQPRSAPQQPHDSTTDLTEWLRQTWNDGAARAKFKLVGVQLPQTNEAGGVRTRQLLSISGPSAGRYHELHATTTATWNWQGGHDVPQLVSLVVEAATLSRSSSPGRLFADCTESVLGLVAEYREQLVYGIDYWLERLDKMLTDQFGHHGLAVGDVNADGLDDVYLCQPGGLPNLLLLQQPDGTVKNQAAAAGVNLLDLSRSALLLDFDNDGDQDLAVATSAQVVLFEHQGQLRFRLAAQLPVRDANSITAADVDADGDLDIYACVYSGDGGESRSSPTPIPIHDARNGGRNVLLRNGIRGGEWEFADATSEVGLDTHNNRWSYAAGWEDYDNDGDLDLYVANDFGRNNLYRNEGGKFVEVSDEVGLDEAAFGMSVSWGDYDRDGFMDVYVSNMFSGAGNRIVGQTSFQPSATAEVRDQLRYAARGNTLFRNRGDGAFEDLSAPAGVTQGRWAWGSLFADLNNDGWEDILVANGFVTRQNAPDL